MTRSSRRANKGKERRPVDNSCDNRCSFARHGLHGRRATDKARTKTSESFDFAELTRGRHFGPPAVKKPCKWPNWGEREVIGGCTEDFSRRGMRKEEEEIMEWRQRG